jgi:hypothetical protein
MYLGVIYKSPNRSTLSRSSSDDFIAGNLQRICYRHPKGVSFELRRGLE